MLVIYDYSEKGYFDLQVKQEADSVNFQKNEFLNL